MRLCDNWKDNEPAPPTLRSQLLRKVIMRSDSEDDSRAHQDHGSMRQVAVAIKRIVVPSIAKLGPSPASVKNCMKMRRGETSHTSPPGLTPTGTSDKIVESATRHVRCSAGTRVRGRSMICLIRLQI